MPWLEITFVGSAGETIPRANDLTVITAEHAIADQGAQVFRDCALELDGQVGNAASCIQYIGADEGVGGADVQAGRAAAAMFGGVRGVNRQGQIDKQFAQEEITAGLAIEYQ